MDNGADYIILIATTVVKKTGTVDHLLKKLLLLDLLAIPKDRRLLSSPIAWTFIFASFRQWISAPGLAKNP